MSCSTPAPSFREPAEASCATGPSTEKDSFDRVVEEVREIDVGKWSRIGKHILTSLQTCDASADDEAFVLEEVASSAVSADCRTSQQHAPEGSQLTDASTDEEADESMEEDDDALSDSSVSSRITSGSASLPHEAHIVSEEPAQDDSAAAIRPSGRPEEAETVQEWRTQLRGRSWADIDEEDDEEREPPQMLLIPNRRRLRSRARLFARQLRRELAETDADDTEDEMALPDDLDATGEEIYPSMHRPEEEPEEEEAPCFEDESFSSADEAEPEPEDCEEEPEAELF